MDIYLKKAIMHIIDRETGSPVFSQQELDLTKEFIRDRKRHTSELQSQ